MAFPSFSFRKRNVFIYSILMLFALATHAQSFQFEREVRTGWTLKFEIDNETFDTTINYTGSTGETLIVQNNYSNLESPTKTYSFNGGQAELAISSINGQRIFEASRSSGFVESGGTIDFKEYQPLVDEYQTALFQTLIGLNSDRPNTIDLLSMFYPHNNMNTRDSDSGAACASVVFSYVAALINEEIQCSIPFNGAACTAAVSTALAALSAVIAVCVDTDDDGDGDGGGDGGSDGGGSNGGGGSTGGNPTTIEIQGGGSGDTGGDGGSGSFQCVYDGEAIVCTTHLN